MASFKVLANKNRDIKMKRNKTDKIITAKGFTLIELMIVIAIIGVIVSFALPSYTEMMRKAKRSDAKIELLRIAQLQENFFAQNLSYAKSLKQLAFSTNSVASAKGLYQVSVSRKTPANCDPEASPPVACLTYELTATPVAGKGQEHDKGCTGFRVDNVSRQWAKGYGSTSFPASAALATEAHRAKAKECWDK